MPCFFDHNIFFIIMNFYQNKAMHRTSKASKQSIKNTEVSGLSPDKYEQLHRSASHLRQELLEDNGNSGFFDGSHMHQIAKHGITNAEKEPFSVCKNIFYGQPNTDKLTDICMEIIEIITNIFMLSLILYVLHYSYRTY